MYTHVHTVYCREYNATILNTEPAGEEILMVGARDRDSGTFGELSYRISAGNREGFFTISSQTGLITIARSLAAAQGRICYNFCQRKILTCT